MKDVLEAGAGPPLRKRELTVAQYLRSQLDAAGRVHAVDVAERRGQQIAAALAGPSASTTRIRSSVVVYSSL